MEVTSKECDNGLTEMRSLIREFLNGKDGTQEVRKYISSVIQDDSLLLIYLKGRNYRVKHAWETLKRKAEIRFNEYPEVFLDSPPVFFNQLQRKGEGGLLKVRDKFGRRVACLNTVAWDPDKFSIEEVTASLTFFMERIQLDEDVLTDGIILAQNCDKVGWKIVKHCTFHVMMRFLDIIWYAYPIKFKGFYFFNCPSYIGYLYKMMKPFFAEELKQLILISTKDKEFKLLHEILPQKVLPKFLGGELDNDEALDFEFFYPPNKL